MRKTASGWLLAIAAVLPLSGCGSTEPKPSYGVGIFADALMQATKYIGSLKDAGGLPGIGKDEHGEFSIHGGYQSVGEPTFVFPVQLEIAAVKETEKDFIYHYLLIKDSREESWKLTKGWKTDQHGFVVIADLLATKWD
jgi:hypothetical protein